MVSLDGCRLPVGSQVQRDGSLHQAVSKGSCRPLFFQGGGIHRLLHLGIHRLHRTQHRRLRLIISQKAAQAQGVIQNRTLLLQVGSYHHTAISNEHQLMVGWHIQNSHVGKHCALPDPGTVAHHFFEQGSGLDHSLNEQAAPTLSDQLYRPAGASCLILLIHHIFLRHLPAHGLGQPLDLGGVTHQHRTDESILLGLAYCLECMFLMGRGYHGGLWRNMLQILFELLESGDLHIKFLPTGGTLRLRSLRDNIFLGFILSVF